MRTLSLLAMASCVEPLANPPDGSPDTPSPQTCPEPDGTPSSFDGPLAPGSLEDWVGTWSGVCRVVDFGDVATTLEVAPLQDGYAWDLQYENEPVRAYTLLPTGQGDRWILDENNGILIDHALIGDQLVGSFTVNGLSIGFHWLRTGDRLDVLMPSYQHTSPRTTTGPGGLVVESFPLAGFQRCTLQRE